MKRKNILFVLITCFVMSTILSGCQKEEIKSVNLQNGQEQILNNGTRGPGNYSFVIRGVAHVYTHTYPDGYTVVEIYCCPPFDQYICCSFTTDQIQIFDRGVANARVTVYGNDGAESNDYICKNEEIFVTNCVVDTVNHYVRFVLD